MSKNAELSKDYVYELIACALRSKKVMSICNAYLKYEYLQTEAQKKVVAFMNETYTLSEMAPTMGTLAQVYSNNTEIVAFLAKVKKVKVVDGTEEQVMKTFESFIKDMKFQQLYHNIAKLYNEGKSEDAYELLKKESEEISSFSIKERTYVEVFSQYNDRTKKRERESTNDNSILFERCTTGIAEMDHKTGGGFRKGSSFLAMARSGIGKSTYLRWVAVSNARLGKKVVMFQGEDTEDNAMTAMDSAWTGITMDNIENATIDEDLLPKIEKTRKEISKRGGQIYLFASEQFNKMTIEECNDKLEDLVATVGPIDIVLWDYLEIFSTKGQWGKAESSERRRREDIAEKITNIAIKYKCVTGTATQSADIGPELLNNPDFCMTRHHASEFKNIVKPFAYFFTFNATNDDYNSQTMRVWLDKLRRHPANIMIKVHQARHIGRFVDSAETQKRYFDFNRYNDNKNATDV